MSLEPAHGIAPASASARKHSLASLVDGPLQSPDGLTGSDRPPDASFFDFEASPVAPYRPSSSPAPPAAPKRPAYNPKRISAPTPAFMTPITAAELADLATMHRNPLRALAGDAGGLAARPGKRKRDDEPSAPVNSRTVAAHCPSSDSTFAS